MRLLIASVAALVIATPGGSAPRRAELFVNALDTRPGARAETDVELSLPSSAASVTVYVPTGYTLEIDRRPGSAIGSATVTTRTGRTSSTLFVATVRAWQAGELTVFVDPGTLVFSPPPGAVDVDLDLRGVLVNPSEPSVLTWRAVVTPASGAPFELRSIVAVPQVLTLKYAAQRLTGRLLFAGRPRPGVNVHLAVATRDDLSDERDLGVARTRANGRYLLSAKLLQGRARQLLVIAYVNFYDGACSDPPPAVGSCARQSIAPPPAEIVAITPA